MIEIVLKRVLDILCAAFGLVLTLPVLLGLIVVIRLETKGPGIFRQKRVGKDVREFTCLKLRSMVAGTRQAGTHEVSSASVTRVGRFLRASKLDEIPQLWNVLKGEMSLVGPRPCLPIQIELIAEREKRGVFEVLPGITGLAQVEGIDMSNPARLAKCDEDYVRGASLLLDLQILARTVLGKGKGDNVSR